MQGLRKRVYHLLIIVIGHWVIVKRDRAGVHVVRVNERTARSTFWFCHGRSL